MLGTQPEQKREATADGNGKKKTLGLGFGLRARGVAAAWQKKMQARYFNSGSQKLAQRLLDDDGRVIVVMPAHPARLTPLRQMPPEVAEEDVLEDLPGAVKAAGMAITCPGRFQEPATAAADGESGSAPVPPRSFSRQCRRIMYEQHSVALFDARQSIMECAFFQACSAGFVRELIAAGGPPIWQGESYDCGSIIYTEGNVGSSLFVVVRGFAEVTATWRQEPGNIAPGEFFGAPQVLGVLTRRHETVHAKTSLHALVISNTVLSRLLKKTRVDDERGGLRDPILEPTTFGSTASSMQGMLPDVGEFASTMSMDVNQIFAHRRSNNQHSGLANSDSGTSLHSKDAASLMQYVFVQERKHFEREAIRLYSEVAFKKLGKKQKSGCKDKSQKEGQESGESGPNTPRGKRLREASSRGSSVAPSLSPSHSEEKLKQGNKAVTRLSPNEALLAKQEQQPVIEWTPAHDRYKHRLVESIRDDVRKGFRMPVDSVLGAVNVQKRKGITPSGIAAKIATGRRRNSASGAKLHGGAAVKKLISANDEDSRAEVNPFDFQLLPPLTLMCSTQKHAVLKNVQEQSRQAAREARAQRAATKGLQHVSLQAAPSMIMTEKPMKSPRGAGELKVPGSPPKAAEAAGQQKSALRDPSKEVRQSGGDAEYVGRRGSRRLRGVMISVEDSVGSAGNDADKFVRRGTAGIEIGFGSTL
eukprot:TRINITY_DN29547_c0_g1_i1.p1 TRINITY_DN29547_c0_g1~~TRINITY_DN29547_c0_g1_i1.p1  ORF type:complete len:701 (-),score=187.14 TRINITY_DN29547_c0_g1_i1:263-2365(-)